MVRSLPGSDSACALAPSVATSTLAPSVTAGALAPGVAVRARARTLDGFSRGNGRLGRNTRSLDSGECARAKGKRCGNRDPYTN